MGNGSPGIMLKGNDVITTDFQASLQNYCEGLMTEAEHQLFFSSLVYFVIALGLVCP